MDFSTTFLAICIIAAVAWLLWILITNEPAK